MMAAGSERERKIKRTEGLMTGGRKWVREREKRRGVRKEIQRGKLVMVLVGRRGRCLLGKRPLVVVSDVYFYGCKGKGREK